MVLEHTNHTWRRGFFGGLTTASSSAGFLLASGIMAALTAVLSPKQFEAWGWLVPFVLSAVLLFVGLYVRSRVSEPPVMQEAVAQDKTVVAPLLEISAGIRARWWSRCSRRAECSSRTTSCWCSPCRTRRGSPTRRAPSC